MAQSRPAVQVQTDNNVDYNVGTLIDDFVYNTIAQWYNEDMGPNDTLPLAPSAGVSINSRLQHGAQLFACCSVTCRENLTGSPAQ